MKVTKEQLKKIIREETRRVRNPRRAHTPMTESMGALPLIGVGAISRNPMTTRPTKAKLNEAAYIHDIFYDAAVALNRRDSEALERLLSDVEGLMLPDDEMRGYTAVLQSMVDAAYELEDAESYY